MLLQKDLHTTTVKHAPARQTQYERKMKVRSTCYHRKIYNTTTVKHARSQCRRIPGATQNESKIYLLPQYNLLHATTERSTCYHSKIYTYYMLPQKDLHTTTEISMYAGRQTFQGAGSTTSRHQLAYLSMSVTMSPQPASLQIRSGGRSGSMQG